MRRVFIISDLHIGGAAPEQPNSRGFRINTHTEQLADFINELAASDEASVELVINGDMLDFLAEKPFEAFTEKINLAIEKLNAIMAREAHFFDALRHFLQRKQRLVLLLGNHDIELAMPAVRQQFEQRINARAKDYLFIIDGEAYCIGTDIIIEHGNRYDSWNNVDFNGLHRLREYQTRNEPIPEKKQFAPPKGSALVQTIMNPLKQKYQFIDLLKPENGAVLPILLALEPNTRNEIATLLSLYLGLSSTNSFEPKTTEREIENAIRGNADLDRELKKALGNEEKLREFEQNMPQAETKNTTRSLNNPPSASSERGGFWSSAWGFFDLLTKGSNGQIEKRLPALLQALGALQNDKSFQTDVETLREYQRAAQELADNGFKYIFFGHTHFARDITLNNKARYINTGTWADLMQLPKNILQGTKESMLQNLHTFIENIRDNKLADYLVHQFTYAEIVLDEHEKPISVELKQYCC